MKRVLLLWISLSLFCIGWAQLPHTKQSDFEKYVEGQNAGLKAYSVLVDADFKSYNDSVNREFGKYLAEAWSSFDLKRKEPPIMNPVPPTVYNPDIPQPEPQKTPVIKEIGPPAPPAFNPETDKPRPNLPQIPVDVPQSGLKTLFFGTSVVFNRPNMRVPALSGVMEKEVKVYWDALSELPYADWVTRVASLKTSLALNDWGMYLLIDHAFDVYFPDSGENERVVFTVFTLNQLGYRAKIGRSGQDLLSLIAFRNNVFNTSNFTYGDERGIDYSVVNPRFKTLTSVQTCRMNYPGATKLMDMSLDVAPKLGISVVGKTLKDRKGTYELEYNRNLVDFYATYPCVDFAVYAKASLDNVFQENIEENFQSSLRQLSQEDAINALLHFVQFAFEYKTDDDQFGYERWFFAEETIASSFSDCEDRSVLFAQLVRRLLKMPVVLLYYPGRHLATAVRFDNPATTGDYLMVDGQKYLICDPTYIGANYGMGMPSLKTVPTEVIKLK